MALKHFVLTRIGLGVFDAQWFARMVPLFMAVTAPSVSRQTSQDFHWLIVVDVALAGAERRTLDEMAAAHPNFHIVTMDVTRMTFMRLGGHDWIWEPCHDYILANGLVEDPSEYVITSTLDADDAWARDYVSLVNAAMEARLPQMKRQEGARGSHLRHSGGAVLTFDRGLIWFIHTDEMAPHELPYHSMAISILARLSSGISALSNRHRSWEQGADVAAFSVDVQNGPHPMWLYVRHDFSVQPWHTDNPTADLMAAGSVPDLEDTFGVDVEKVRAWRAGHPGPDRHEGQSAADQYARMFRLTGLNRQIAALETRAGSDAAAMALLERQQLAREALVAELRGKARQ